MQAHRRAVQQETKELKAVLEALEAKKQERQWLRHKDAGDLDDRKLVDVGLALAPSSERCAAAVISAAAALAPPTGSAAAIPVKFVVEGFE